VFEEQLFGGRKVLHCLPLSHSPRHFPDYRVTLGSASLRD
jgi:hypothetical protein